MQKRYIIYIVEPKFYLSMVHIYYLIVAGREVDTNSTFYQVSVSSSAQGDRDFLYLTAFAVDGGHYFVRKSAMSSDFVHKLALSLFPESPSNCDCLVPFQKIKARNLVRALKKSCANPLAGHSLSNRHQTLTYLNGNYRAFSNLNNWKSFMLCVKRS